MENQEDKSLLDFLKVQPNETDRAKVTNQRALLAGATPLLVGLLAGNTGDAYEIASKALLDEDQRKLKEEGSLIDYLRKRQMANEATAAKSKQELALGKQQQVKLSDGRIASYSPVTGKVYDPTSGAEIRGAEFYRETPELAAQKTKARQKAMIDLGVKGRTFGTDTQGRIVLRDTVKGTMTPIGDTSKMAPKVRKRLLDNLDTFNNKTAKKQIEAIDAAIQFQEAIKLGEGNPIAGQYAIFTLAKSADNGGRLSDQDVERFGGSKALKARIDQIAQTAKLGTMTKENIDFMKEIAEVMLNTNRKLISQKAASFSKGRNKLIGDDIYPYIMDSLPSAAKIQPKAKAKAGFVIMTNGEETLEVPVDDMEEAKQDGFKVVQ